VYLTIKRTMIAGFALTAMFVAACTAENKSPPTTSVLTDSSEIAPGAPQSTQLSKEALQALGEEIAGWVESGDPIGAEILVAQHGNTVFHEVYGWDDREEERLLARNSIFRLRSMTKPIVGTAVLMLAEDGKLGLDDTVAQYLPSFENDRSRSITIRQLLTHTSGLGDHGRNDIGLSKKPSDFESLRALVDEIGEIGPAAGGGDFHYSDSGSSTLGAIVAEVSGMPAEQFIQERILQPLGMTDTYSRFEPDAPWAKRMNSTYQQSQGSCDFEKYWDRSMAQTFKYFRASGGLYSTTGDYMRFLAMWMNRGVHEDKRLLSEATVDAALAPYIDAGYGMHWDIDVPRMTNGLPAEFGHGGSDGTLAMAFPELDATVLFFTQSRRSRARVRFIEALAGVEPFSDILPNDPRRFAFEEQWEKASEHAQEAPENADKYAGTYSQGDLQHEVVLQDKQLGYIFSSSSVATPIKQIADGVFIGKHPCYHILFRITFDAVNDEVLKYRFEAGDGWEAEFTRQ